MKITHRQLRQIIKEALNEKSETRSRFEKAFAQAREAGEETFEFEGELYTTELAEEDPWCCIPIPIPIPDPSPVKALALVIKNKLEEYDRDAEKFLGYLSDQSEILIPVSGQLASGKTGQISVRNLLERKKGSQPYTVGIQAVIDVMTEQGDLDDAVATLGKLLGLSTEINGLNHDYQDLADQLHREVDGFNTEAFKKYSAEFLKLSQEERAKGAPDELWDALGLQMGEAWDQFVRAWTPHPQVQEMTKLPGGANSLVVGIFQGGEGNPFPLERFYPAMNLAHLYENPNDAGEGEIKSHIASLMGPIAGNRIPKMAITRLWTSR